MEVFYTNYYFNNTDRINFERGGTDWLKEFLLEDESICWLQAQDIDFEITVKVGNDKQFPSVYFDMNDEDALLYNLRWE